MVVEKGTALTKAQLAAAAALASGRGVKTAKKRAFGTYKRAVSKNRRRLSRRR
jgi:TPR repeat protein